MSGIHIHDRPSYGFPRTIVDSGQPPFEGRDWTNIQSIVKSTFKSLSDVVKLQGEALRKLEDSTDVFRRDVNTSLYKTECGLKDLDLALDGKVSVDQMLALHKEALDQIAQLSNALRNKADDVSVRALLEDRPTRAAVRDLIQEAMMAQHARTVQEVQESVRAAAEPLAESVESLKRSLARLAGRVEKDGEMTANALRSIGNTFDNVEQAITGLKERTAHTEAALPKIEALASRLEASVSSLRQRTDKLEPLESAVSSLTARLQSLATASEGATSKLSSLEGGLSSLDTKLESGLSSLESAVQAKADRRDIRRALESLEEVKGALEREVAGVHELRGAIREEVKGELRGELRAELKDRPTVREMCDLLDTKADVEDVSSSLAEVARQIDTRVPLKDYEKSLAQQHAVNSNLCSEMCTARWLWKSGKLKTGNVVGWNLESINTDPSNFVWEKNAPSITCVVPGLYEVTFGFFARKKPQVQLLVDGQPVLLCTNSSSLSLGAKIAKPHPAGTVTGLTLSDFLALPPKAKLSVIYQGEEMGEGFLQLKKL